MRRKKHETPLPSSPHKIRRASEISSPTDINRSEKVASAAGLNRPEHPLDAAHSPCSNSEIEETAARNRNADKTTCRSANETNTRHHFRRQLTAKTSAAARPKNENAALTKARAALITYRKRGFV